MASVDDIFKRSGITSKRKLDPIRDPNEIYKSARTSSNDGHRHAHVEDELDEDEAGPALPPGEGEADEFGPELPPEDDAADDDEDRFFGGGITKQEAEILDYVEDADEGKDVQAVDIGWLRKTALNFEKRITKNAELRAKHEGDPQKFIASEADLDADIKGLSILSEHPALYEEFVKIGCAESLVGLLAHENTDIAIDAIEIVGELTDEDVNAEEGQWNALVDAVLDADLIGLLTSNLSRFNEDDESDRNGVYYALGILENLCSRTAAAVRIGEADQLLRWLLRRIQRKEAVTSQNKQYAAEVLAILAQASEVNRRNLETLDATDMMLQLVSQYRKRDPDKGGEEEEYMENLFETLTCFVDDAEGKIKFMEAEGLELCLIMVKEGKRSRGPALRLLDHAVGGLASAPLCVKAIEAGGLKTIFTLFNKTQDYRLIGHILTILASMLRLLPSESAERIRTLAKFVEKDYQKISKLIKLREEYKSRVEREEELYREEIEAARTSAAEDAEAELLSRRLEAGQFSLQVVDVILAWLVAEDVGARHRIEKLLKEHGEGLQSIRRTLSEQKDGLDLSEEDSRDLGDMLDALLRFLQ